MDDLMQALIEKVNRDNSGAYQDTLICLVNHDNSDLIVSVLIEVLKSDNKRLLQILEYLEKPPLLD